MGKSWKTLLQGTVNTGRRGTDSRAEGRKRAEIWKVRLEKKFCPQVQAGKEQREMQECVERRWTGGRSEEKRTDQVVASQHISHH